ncbi:hypothetical protein K438DRAFT_1779531 [Mycena galopus ATCC 62051]|nr:hypothetical protein K438DRAFT_1779531 [Mycena galopus ATCC 62051]
MARGNEVGQRRDRNEDPCSGNAGGDSRAEGKTKDEVSASRGATCASATALLAGGAAGGSRGQIQLSRCTTCNGRNGLRQGKYDRRAKEKRGAQKLVWILRQDAIRKIRLR